MPRIKGFDEIEAEIALHPGKIALDEWANLSRIFIDIYQRNRNELIKLLDWNRWSSKAKTYIENGDVNLLDAIQQHGSMIDAAYGVLLNLSSGIHNDDINAVNELIHRRNDILSGKIKL